MTKPPRTGVTVIKAIGGEAGRPLVLFGLSRGSCKKLLRGKPIRIDMAELERPDLGVVYIMAGETEEEMRAYLDKHGLLPPKMRSS